MIAVTIRVTALPEKRKELLQTICSMLEETRKERGCLYHHWFRDIEDQDGFILVEEWESQEDLKRYLSSDRFRVLLGAMHILARPPEIRLNRVSELSNPEALGESQEKYSP